MNDMPEALQSISTGTALLNPRAVLKEVGFVRGMRYADFGCGPLGHFAIPAAMIAGEKGHVYAVDIMKKALAGVESLARLEHVTNLTAVWGDFERFRGTRIPELSLDCVSFVNDTHLLAEKPGILEEVKRVLKQGGLFFLVDWNADGIAFGPPKEARVNPEAVKPAILRAGFQFEKSFRAGPRHWGIVFRWEHAG